MSGEEREPVIVRDNRKIDPVTGEARKVPPAAGPDPVRAAGTAEGSSAPEQVAAAEEDVPKAEALLLEERTRDLQRVQAEYANYRKRAERDRLAAGDLAVGRTLGELLPVIDDLDRARAHGDLTGPLKAVADKLEAVFTKLGLHPFGEVGDPFDPALHDAVMHDESDAVTVPTCTTVMRQGYKHGERLLRPAMVGVTDPAVFQQVAEDGAPLPSAEADRQGERTAQAEPHATDAQAHEEQVPASQATEAPTTE
jgi:molecular chaperone GrpE